MARLQAAVSTATAPTIASRPIDVTQGQTNVSAPLLGPAAIILPAPAGAAINPNPLTLAELDRVWGCRRDTWTRQAAQLMGTTAADTSWFVPLQVAHRAASMQSGGPCGLHFVFDGQAFEVLYAGNDVVATLIADGQYQTPEVIRRAWSGGVAGAPLEAWNTYLRFHFGTRAQRRITLYSWARLGPCAIAIGPNDNLSAWDRGAEPALCGLADSYAGASTSNWHASGLFFEAAMQLGIPHVDIDGIGGTGYAPNSTNVHTQNPGNAFGARIAGVAASRPDLFLTAGGVNDNSWFASPPVYATADAARAGFAASVHAYYRDLRAALPNAVLASIGPWQPNVDYVPGEILAKAATIRAAIQAVAPPWIFVDNLQGGWVNSSGASAPSTGQPWQTGTGNEAAPKGDGNGDLYLSADGVHPNRAGAQYLGTRLAENLRPAILAL